MFVMEEKGRKQLCVGFRSSTQPTKLMRQCAGYAQGSVVISAPAPDFPLERDKKRKINPDLAGGDGQQITETPY